MSQARFDMSNLLDQILGVSEYSAYGHGIFCNNAKIAGKDITSGGLNEDKGCGSV